MTVIDRRYSVAEGVSVKAPCRVATTANITLAGEQTIDGVAVVERDRVLVRSQIDATTNGIYEVSTGNWARAKDCDGAFDLVKGSRVFVLSGSTNGLKEFYCTTADPIVVGTASIAFAVLSDGGTSGSSKYDTRTDAAAADIPSLTSWVEVAGFRSMGDGGAQVDVPISAPNVAKRWHFQDANGRWRELAANEFYPEMLGAYGDGTHDDTAVFQDLATIDVNGNGRRLWLTPGKTYALDGMTDLATDTQWNGFGATVTQNGTVTQGGIPHVVPALRFLGKDRIHIRGGKYTTFDRTKPMHTSYYGLIFGGWDGSYNYCGDVIVEDTLVYDAASGIVLSNCRNAKAFRNHVHDFMVYAINLSGSTLSEAAYNYIHDSAMTEADSGPFGGINSYGISGTGSQTNGGVPDSSIQLAKWHHNMIVNIPQFDGMQSEGIYQLEIENNYLANVRVGCDVSIGDQHGRILRVIIRNNWIVGCSTDEFNGSAASHGAVHILGAQQGETAGVGDHLPFPSDAHIEDAIIEGNVAKNFFTVPGIAVPANSGALWRVANADRFKIVNNWGIGSGTEIDGVGVMIVGECGSGQVTGNYFGGSYGTAVIRLAGNSDFGTSMDLLRVSQNTAQVDASNDFIYLDGYSSITKLVRKDNTTNSTNVLTNNGTITTHEFDDYVVKAVTSNATSGKLDLSNCSAVRLQYGSDVTITGVINATPGRSYAVTADTEHATLASNGTTFLIDSSTITMGIGDTVRLFALADNEARQEGAVSTNV